MVILLRTYIEKAEKQMNELIKDIKALQNKAVKRENSTDEVLREK